jgi:hypothetical protein
MLEYEYNNIIDYWSEYFKIRLGKHDKKAIVKLYENYETQFNQRSLDFNAVCQQVLLESFCELKYPGMNLYVNTFSYWARN